MIDYILNKDTANELINVDCRFLDDLALNTHAIILMALCCVSLLETAYKKKTIKDFRLSFLH